MAEQCDTSSEPGEDAAERLKSRLRGDLKSAMMARAALETAALRAIIAALDNAQAVPAHDRHARYVVHKFGDPSAEVPRLRLGLDDVRKLLEREVRDRVEAADQFEKLGRHDRAAALRAEADIALRYLNG
jgi:uncharacterized protein YqeY